MPGLGWGHILKRPPATVDSCTHAEATGQARHIATLQKSDLHSHFSLSCRRFLAETRG